MIRHSEKRNLPSSAEQMIQLVSDISSYPDFIPWCSDVEIKNKFTSEDSTLEILEADLLVTFKFYKEKFGSQVTVNYEEYQIKVEYLHGPFKYLLNNWSFIQNDGFCTVEFEVEFEFKSKIMQNLIGSVFNIAMKRVVSAFEKRAETLYGF